MSCHLGTLLQLAFRYWGCGRSAPDCCKHPSCKSGGLLDAYALYCGLNSSCQGQTLQRITTKHRPPNGRTDFRGTTMNAV
eukprot:4721946-Amphidinium_carterae.2